MKALCGFRNDLMFKLVSSFSFHQLDIDIKFNLDTDIALSITEQTLLFLLILCRWVLPRGDITRDQLSQLLFVFIGKLAQGGPIVTAAFCFYW